MSARVTGFECRPPLCELAARAKAGGPAFFGTLSPSGLLTRRTGADTMALHKLHHPHFGSGVF